MGALCTGLWFGCGLKGMSQLAWPYLVLHLLLQGSLDGYLPPANHPARKRIFGSAFENQVRHVHRPCAQALD